MLNFTNSLRTIKCFILLITITTFTNAATIKGKVMDGKTKEGLTGALVFNKNDIKITDVAGLDGSFSIRNVAVGKYTLVAKFIGFTDLEKEVTVNDANEVITVDFMMEPLPVSLNQYTVVSEYEKGSDNYARSAEKNSENTLNIMSSKSIELSPDITIANVLQRVSGVTVSNSASGEPKFAVIRGMEKRYNYTTIDGIKIPSPDNKSRAIPMDVFPSEIVERLEVIKSLTPSMEGDAIGGVINLVLKNAPDKFICNATLATGYSQMDFDRSYSKFDAGVVNKKSPEELNGSLYNAVATDFQIKNYEYNNVKPAPNIFSNFSIGNRFLNEKLGVIVSGSYQNTFSQSKSMFLTQSAQPNYIPANTPVFDDIQIRDYYTQFTREALHGRVNYDFNKNNQLSFYTVYVGMDEVRHRHISDTIENINVGEVDKQDESKVTHQSIYSAALHGEHTLIPNLKFDWSGAYADAYGNTPDWGTLTITGSSLSPAETWQKFTRRWMNNNDVHKTGLANLAYKLKVFGKEVELKVGGMDRDKRRDTYYDSYKLAFTPNQSVTTLDSATFTVSDPLGTTTDANNYSITENDKAIYAQAKFSVGNLQVLGGARKEFTKVSYNTSELMTFPGKYGTITYNDLLPSISLKYAINEKHNLRASYFASINRPDFYELIPYSITGETYDFAGNPYLLHAQANNYDFRYEFYPKQSEQLLAGVFYKDITNPIEYAIQRAAGKISALVEMPQNFGTAKNYGFEFVATKYIKHFGITANYTYTHSEITTTKLLYYFDQELGSTYKIVDQTRPLQGQAAHIANLALLYKDQKIGLDMNLSVVYTGKLISQVSPNYNLDYWQMPMTRLDFSFQKRICKKINLSVYGKVNNLLNTQRIIRILQANPYTANGPFFLPQQDDPGSIIVEKEQFGQNYLLGIRYKF